MRGDHSSLDAWSYSKALTYLELEIFPHTCAGSRHYRSEL